MFKSLDVDGGGTLDIEEVRVLGDKLGYEFTDNELSDAMAEMDHDKSGEVDFNEFYEWWLQRKQSGDYDIHAKAASMFKEIDSDNSGSLDKVEVRELAERLDFHFSETELNRTWAELDTDGSGEVDFREFYKWWASRQRRGDQQLHNEAARLFAEVDVNGDGKLNKEEIKELGSRLGFKFSDMELEAAIAEMDFDQSGQVDFPEFYEWYILRKQRGTAVQIGRSDLAEPAASILQPWSWGGRCGK